MLEISKRRSTRRIEGKISDKGDLNLIRNIDEKLEGNYFRNPSRAALEELIEEHKLLDISPSNGKFT